jgi:poly(A) polymerase
MSHSSQRADAPRIIPRSEHRVSRQDIDENALKVLYRLHKAGFEAYLVGGGVRDLLLGKHPKDFDVATNALPEQVNELFRNCRLIGRRFRLAHIHFGREIVEVATFRGHHDQTDDESVAHVHNGMIVRDNVFGTLEEDAWRRDFSVNALYYNIADFSVIDYTGGIEDLQLKRLRMLGDAHLRCQEDPVRILRAIRFAAKLDFQLDTELVAAIDEQRDRLQAVPPARLFDELIKMFLGGHAEATLRLLVQYDLLQMLFAMSDQQLKAGDEQFYTFLLQALKNTDARVQDDKPVTPAFLFAAMLWGPVNKHALQLQADGMSPVQSLQEAGRGILHAQVSQIAIPKRFRLPIREIWTGQARIKNRRGRRVSWLIAHARFRAIYDFLLLRQQAGEAELDELAEWWTRYQEADNPERKAMCQDLQQKRQGHRPRNKK